MFEITCNSRASINTNLVIDVQMSKQRNHRPRPKTSRTSPLAWFFWIWLQKMKTSNNLVLVLNPCKSSMKIPSFALQKKSKERQHVWHFKNPIDCETFYREMIRGLTWRVAGLQDTEGSRSVYQSLAIKFYSNLVRHRLQSRWTRVIPNRFLARPRFLPLKPPASSHLSPLKIHQNLAPMFLHQNQQTILHQYGPKLQPLAPLWHQSHWQLKPHKAHHPKLW